MKGSEFVRKIQRLGRDRGIETKLVKSRGKGDHATLYYGERFTIVGGRYELKTGTLHGMLRQLGLTIKDLEE